MHSVTSTTVVVTAAHANDVTLFASLESSKSKWVVTINSPGSEKFFQAYHRGWRWRRPARPFFGVEGEGRAALRRAGRPPFRTGQDATASGGGHATHNPAMIRLGKATTRPAAV
jgi:hypothetical protein